MMKDFFQKITRENWGFPWHILLASIGQMLGTSILLRFAEVGTWASLLISAVVVFLIGWLYEVWQRRSADREKPAAYKQDLLANLSGIVLGIGLFWL